MNYDDLIRSLYLSGFDTDFIIDYVHRSKLRENAMLDTENKEYILCNLKK